jgi:hypothetical protein
LVKAAGRGPDTSDHDDPEAEFDEQPLKPLLLYYCVQDVVYLPKLWNVYLEKMDGFWKVIVKEASESRSGESIMTGYSPAERIKVHVDWSEVGIERALGLCNRGRREWLFSDQRD